ncbi:hypothetical protein [Bifidobacterium sp. ESL0745]|uniref:hypothetical protein n=1 Tax=Bifidobacterium sp. ESL0745 TaxID=2983226 RepID=UPI0023F66D2D|nr:hypothetical protein [Bifidobacterium sp. ESL0745]MDF7666124.1 hypothetical protein [Bifidobacterium sp. ESL0745]
MGSPDPVKRVLREALWRLIAYLMRPSRDLERINRQIAEDDARLEEVRAGREPIDIEHEKQWERQRQYERQNEMQMEL